MNGKQKISMWLGIAAIVLILIKFKWRWLRAPSDKKPLTEGEVLFERYLRDRKLKWKKEVLFGQKRPDYLVRTKFGKVLCEVKDFDEGGLDKAVLKAVLSTMRPFLADGTEYTRQIDSELRRLQKIEANNGGAWNPIPRLQKKMKKAASQLRDAKGKLPCIVVVYNPGFMPHERDLFMRIGLAQNRFFTPNQGTTISAVAVLTLIYPNKELLTSQTNSKADEVIEQLQGKSSREVALAIIEQLGELENSLKAQQPEGFFDEAVPCLKIYHNKFAAKPLPLQSLTGEYDEHVTHSNLWSSPETSSETGLTVTTGDTTAQDM